MKIFSKNTFLKMRQAFPATRIFSAVCALALFSNLLCAEIPPSFSAPAQMSPREAEVLKNVSKETLLERKIEILESASAKEWAGLAIFFNLANLNYERGDFSVAVKNYEKALEKSPNFFAARKNLGFTLDAMGEKSKAECEMKKALALSGGSDANILLWLADKYSIDGDWFSALSCCNQSLIYEAKNDAALSLKSQLLYQCGFYSDCLNLTSEILAKDFSRPQIWKTKAMAQIKLGDARGAISSLEALLMLGVDDLNTNISLASLYYNEGLYDKSAELYESILKDKNASVDVLVSGAKAFIFANRPDAALKILNEMHSQNSEILQLKGEAFYALEKFEDAEKFFREFLKKNPHHAGVSLRMGKICKESSRILEAEEFFTTAAFNESLAAEALYGILQCRAGLGDVGGALEILSKLRKIKDSPELAEYEKSLKKFQSAKEF